MKVGTITLLTALLLALPLTAFAGADPCLGLGGDTDGDTICDNNDNCPDTSNVAQGDMDADGQGDVCDNCTLVPNGPAAGPYPGRDTAGALTPGLQCDVNADGYGNACDADMNNDGFTLALDFGLFAGPAISAGAPAAFVWVANIPGGTLQHPLAQAVDMNCDNFKTSVDVGTYFNPQLSDPLGPLMNHAPAPGRSGLSCVAPPGAPTTPLSCAPHN